MDIFPTHRSHFCATSQHSNKACLSAVTFSDPKQQLNCLTRREGRGIYAFVQQGKTAVKSIEYGKICMRCLHCVCLYAVAICDFFCALQLHKILKKVDRINAAKSRQMHMSSTAQPFLTKGARAPDFYLGGGRELCCHGKLPEAQSQVNATVADVENQSQRLQHMMSSVSKVSNLERRLQKNKKRYAMHQPMSTLSRCSHLISRHNTRWPLSAPPVCAATGEGWEGCDLHTSNLSVESLCGGL